MNKMSPHSVVYYVKILTVLIFDQQLWYTGSMFLIEKMK
jgi:hypothetical protein